MHTPPPHINSSEERLPRLTCCTHAQLRTNKSPFHKSYLHKVEAKTHPSPLCPLCNIHTHDTHHIFNCTHICTTLSPLDLWTDPARVTALLARWTEKLAGRPQAGTWVDNNNTNIPDTIIKFIATYIKGHKAYTTYKNHTSKTTSILNWCPLAHII